MKKYLISAFLVLVALSMIFTACTKDPNSQNKEEIPSAYVPLLSEQGPLVVVVRPDNSTQTEKDVAMELKTALSEKIGKMVTITVDWGFDKTKYPDNTLFVSVGNTTLEQVQSVALDQSTDNCKIKLIDDVLVLASTDDMYLGILVEKLMSSVVCVDSMWYMDMAKAEYDSGAITATTVVSAGVSDYTVVFENTKGESTYPAQIASKVVSAIKEDFGAELKSISDNQKASKEIVVGVCRNRAESAAIAAELAYNEYAIKLADDGTIYLCGKNYETTLRAVEKFVELASLQKKSGELKLASVLASKYTIKGLPNVPLYENSTDFELISSVLDSSAMYYKNASVEGYNKYLDELSDAGFELVVKNEIKENIFATLQNKEAIINCYYTAYDSSVRVCVDSKEHTEIHNYEPKSVKAITTPMLIQFTSGCGYILRLEDGTFIIYDSGMTGNVIYKNLYESLQKYNVTNTKPIVRAWMYSHPHVDHVGGFFNFSENYASSIVVQQFIYNNPTRSHYQYTIDDPPDGDVLLEDRINKFLDYCDKYYPSADVVVGHTGQIMYFGNTKAEILHTHEDDYPTHLAAGNQISMLVRFTFDNQTILFTGDMHQTSAPIIVNMFGDHLKSDILQIPHHGYNGGTDTFYNAVKAPTCIFTNSYEGYLSVRNQSQNKIALKIAKQVLVPTDDSDIMSFPLPYKTADGEKWNRK